MPIVCQRILLYNETTRSAWTVSVSHKRRVCCIPAAYALQTAHSWANARVLLGARMRRKVAFETIKLIDANILLCIIFGINYHPHVAQINMQGASVLVLM